MESIKLPRGEWRFDPAKPLGPAGGFGEVFEGQDSNGNVVAVKRLKITADKAAHREMRIAEDLAGRTLEGVIPVLDAGQDADSDRYFVVMPKADGSLQELVNRGSIPVANALEILLAIANGLDEVEDLVHRDLKPGNVLFHDGRWKIADFGIARFVEDSTSLQTLQGNLSPPYAAPEQWNLERATNATDIYALGCIAYALFTGRPPFEGPKAEDFRQQHLKDLPASLPVTVPARLRSIVSAILRKHHAARPTLVRVREVLKAAIDEQDTSTATASQDQLAQAGAEVAEEEARRDAERASLENEAAQREALGRDALDQLRGLMEDFYGRVQNVAPATKRDKDQLSLGAATLRWTALPIPVGFFPKSKWEVVAGAWIQLHQRPPLDGYRGRSSSLWYLKRSDEEGYRWMEVSYFEVFGGSHDEEPYAVNDPNQADMAAAPVLGSLQHAMTPTPMDDENFDDFCARWMARLAAAAKGQLRRPSSLPES